MLKVEEEQGMIRRTTGWGPGGVRR